MVKRQLSRKAINNVRRRSVRSQRQRGGEMINVRLYDLHDELLSSIKLPRDTTVLDLKQRIAEQKLIPRAESINVSIELENKKTLDYYGVNNNIILNVDYDDVNLQEQHMGQQDSQDDFDY